MSPRRVTLPKDDAEWQRLLSELFGADDRTAVILGGVLVEAALESLVRSWLLPEATLGFLSNFGAKKDLARALGFIEDGEAEHLQAIASIRNVFAHDLLEARFEDPTVRENIDKLRKVRNARPEDAPRAVFRNAVVRLTTSLNFRKREPITAKAFRQQAMRRVRDQWKAAQRKYRKAKGGS